MPQIVMVSSLGFSVNDKQAMCSEKIEYPIEGSQLGPGQVKYLLDKGSKLHDALILSCSKSPVLDVLMNSSQFAEEGVSQVPAMVVKVLSLPKAIEGSFLLRLCLFHVLIVLQ